MTTSEREVVAVLGEAITQRIGEPRYNLWFANKTRFRCDNDQLVVGVSNHFYQEWLQKTFTDELRAAAADVFGRPMQVRFAIDPELSPAPRREEAVRPEPTAPVAANERRGLSPPCQGQTAGINPAAHPPTTRPPAQAKARKRRWHHLRDFIVGACNRVAYASALSVVEEPGQGANPLVLHGPVGTGKTHLLEGIYAGLRKTQPEWRVCFVTAEDFTNRFVQAMRLGKLGAFRKHFREVDALLLDDLHFLASKRATQEEFLHTFDVLQADERQVVLTLDCHPRLSDQFMPELTDRLLGGAVWSLTPPDAETRLALLRGKSLRGSEAAVPDAVLQYLAQQLRGNVRELEGALHSVQHYSKVAGRKVDLTLAREALADLLRHSVRVVQLADVERMVCQVLRLEADALQSKKRAWHYAHPRMLAVYLARKHTSATYTEVGLYFGGRNHSTAVAAEKKVRQWLEDDATLTLGERQVRVRELVERIEHELLR
ncbi:MAG TPA: chromosomal replication initiator protein DnaA [Gemmataceae bacterium]|nr:chromosomal replication initiator protein DnaA [Gemmataceae bacterium]